MRVVLDTSAAVGIVMRASGWEIFEKTLANAEWVETPDLFISEVTNTYWKYFKLGNLNRETCEKALAQTIAMPDLFVPAKELFQG